MSDLNTVFAALSDPTRRAIIERLEQGETPLSILAEPFDMSQTAVTRHVRVLRDAGLVEIEKRGRVRHCRLRAAPMQGAMNWLKAYEQFWIGKLDALALHLEAEKKEERK